MGGCSLDGENTTEINCNFCCINCLHSFKIENKLKSYEIVCKKYNCYIEKCLKDIIMN